MPACGWCSRAIDPASLDASVCICDTPCTAGHCPAVLADEPLRPCP